MKAKISASKSRVALAMFVACVCALPVRAQSSGASEVISDPFPLSEATRRLGDRYAVAVTYEDAILLRMDEIVLIGKRPEEPFSYRAVRNPITMPEELTPAVTPKLSSEVLGKLIGAFSATNPNASGSWSRSMVGI
jgi:hypothetical protein